MRIAPDCKGSVAAAARMLLGFSLHVAPSRRVFPEAQGAGRSHGSHGCQVLLDCCNGIEPVALPSSPTLEAATVRKYALCCIIACSSHAHCVMLSDLACRAWRATRGCGDRPPFRCGRPARRHPQGKGEMERDGRHTDMCKFDCGSLNLFNRGARLTGGTRTRTGGARAGSTGGARVASKSISLCHSCVAV